jgi:hypothetical protein
VSKKKCSGLNILIRKYFLLPRLKHFPKQESNQVWQGILCYNNNIAPYQRLH